MNSSHAINTRHALCKPYRRDWVGWETAGPASPARCLWPPSQACLEQKLAHRSTDMPGLHLPDSQATPSEAHDGLQDKWFTTDQPYPEVQPQGPICAYQQVLVLEQQGKSVTAGPAPLTALWSQVAATAPWLPVVCTVACLSTSSLKSIR